MVCVVCKLSFCGVCCAEAICFYCRPGDAGRYRQVAVISSGRFNSLIGPCLASLWTRLTGALTIRLRAVISHDFHHFSLDPFYVA